jgi:hypothetical protein
VRYRIYVKPWGVELYIGVWEIGEGGRNRVLGCGSIDEAGPWGESVLQQLRVLQGPEEAQRLAYASHVYIKFIPVEEKSQPPPSFRV